MSAGESRWLVIYGYSGHATVSDARRLWAVLAYLSATWGRDRYSADVWGGAY